MKRPWILRTTRDTAPSAGVPVDRRAFLRAGLAGAAAASTAVWLLPGCASDLSLPPPDGGEADGGTDGRPPGTDGAVDASDPERDAAADSGAVADAVPADSPDVAPRPTPACVETNDNLLGPYYRAGAPMRSELVAAGKRGTRLTVSGRVFGLANACMVPLPGVLLDVWQADHDGRYDNDPSMPPPGPGRFVLRGRLLTDALGEYAFRTIVPGRYLNGAQYRPAHIHVRVSAPGLRTLTTQLYFPDDPFNAIDTIIRPGLIMAVTDLPDGTKTGLFDFVLRAA